MALPPVEPYLMGMNTTLSFTLRSLLAVGALSLGGCHVFVRGPRHHVEPRHEPRVVHREPARVTVVTRSEPDHHSCHDECDHHWDGASFVIVSGHRHGHHCGHERQNNRWVVARIVVTDERRGDDHGNGRGNDHDNGRGNGRGNGNGNGGGR